MSESGLLSGERIRELVTEVAEQLGVQRTRATIIMVGGSLLAWHGLRSATEDVDTTVHLDAELRSAVRVVAERHRLAVDWLNDHAAPWHPETLRPEQCDLLLDHPRLRVLGAPLADVFLMKLNRSEPQDVLDMIMLWPLVVSVFPTGSHVVDAFYQAYPLEEPDDHLGAFVVDLAERAGLSLPLR